MASPGQNQIRVFGINLCAATAVRAFTIAFVLIVFATQVVSASTFNVIYNFTGARDGTSPYAGLTVDAAGNLYGTTLAGGAGFGSVFKMSKSGAAWNLATLYRFAGGNDGASPRSKVILGPDGNLYGQTFAGGGQGCSGRGCGTIFKVSLTGVETVLYRFTGGSDGAEPTGDLLFDAAGNLYGTTVNGGKRGCGTGCGTVYKLTNTGGTWTESIVYQFQGGADGAFPSGGVIFDYAGNLYGTTCCGGSHAAGTVFQLAPSTPLGSTWTQKILYTFQGTTDGNEPVGGLVFDSWGSLYGSTMLGGTSGGGTVFELTPSGGTWTFSLCLGMEGTAGTMATMMMDRGGNLYGTTFQGGANNFGSVFEMTSSPDGWIYTSFHDFTNGRDGGYPLSNLVFGSTGNLYGTAALGGRYGNGVVVEIVP